jgi:hypothetical protein
MSFTRVIQDGVEFFTITETGESYLSESGIARLCDVFPQAVSQRVQSLSTSKSLPKTLKAFAGFKVSLQEDYVLNGLKVKINLIPADLCAALIEYYAFESPKRSKTAQYSFRKFAGMGMNGWIQQNTGWKQPEPAAELTPELLDRYLAEYHPEGTIAITANPKAILNILKNSDFSAAGYRIFLYLELQRLLDQTPEIDQICTELNLNRPTLMRWLPKITQWSQCADEIQLQTRQGTEFDIQRRLHAELGGQMEVYTPAGRIDLVTDTEIIEIKRIAAWKDAFGEVVTKGLTFPKHRKRIHLFGKSDKLLANIISHCERLKVSVSFEFITESPSPTPAPEFRKSAPDASAESTARP